MFWFLMITALSGVLPIMISLKQSNFYMLASFPLFAIAWACIFTSPLQQLVNRISVKATQILNIISLLLVLGGVDSIIVHYGTISQDRQLLTDIHQLLPHIPEHTTIGIDKSMFEECRLYPYFARYKNISLDCEQEHDFLMLRDSTMIKNYHNPYILKLRTPTLLL